MARQNMGTERMVSYSEIVRSNRGWFVNEWENQSHSGIQSHVGLGICCTTLKNVR